MDYRIFLEWDEQCGISLSKMYPLIDGVENAFKGKYYGKSINLISVVITATFQNFKQRKRFKKESGIFEYDIILDHPLIKNIDLMQKKIVIRKQMIEITEQTFNKYKFDDFDKDAFLFDYKEIVSNVAW